MINFWNYEHFQEKLFKKANVPQTLWCQIIYAFFTRQWIKNLAELEYTITSG